MDQRLFVRMGGIYLTLEATTDIYYPMDYTADIRDYVVSYFLFGDDSSLQDNTSFLASGIVDSTGVMELVMFLEQEFNIKIEPEDMIPANLDSVNQVAQFIERKQPVAAFV